ncbi:MAG: response regulator [bacterium]
MTNVKRVLLVDDSEIDRKILKNILSRYFEIIEAENGYEALEIMEKRSSKKIDGVFLDISMPVLDGFNILEIMSEHGIDIKVILVTAEATATNVQRAIHYNVKDFISKPFKPSIILEKVKKIFGIEIEEVKEESFDETEIYETDTYISRLSSMYKSYLKNINLDDSHYCRVEKLVGIFLTKYDLANMIESSKIDIATIAKAAYFYDIGLMGIPTEFIHQTDILEEERKTYEKHTVMGANIIWTNGSESCKMFVKICQDMCMHHHERYDGKGFPHGLKGSDNSIYSQLCSLAIRFDSLFSKRSEFNDWQFDFVVNELKIDKGAFYPKYLELLEQCKTEVIKYYRNLEISGMIAVG